MKKTLLILILLVITKINDGQSLFKELNNNLDGNEIIAEVGTIKITSGEFFYSYEYGPAFYKKESGSKESLLKYMINEKLLALSGYENNILEEEETLSMVEDFTSDLATEEMFKDEILGKVHVSKNEIDTIINSKLIELEIKWLYSPDQNGAFSYLQSIKNGNSFDSLFISQINDSVYLDMRMMNISAFDLMKKNPALYQITDTLKAGNISAPIHTGDGWYIIKLNNITKNVITAESEHNKLEHEAKQAVTKFKMDELSDRYVDSLMKRENLIIKRDAFNVLLSYLGKYVLTDEKYNEWELEEKLETALGNLGLSKSDEYPGIKLVTGDNQSYNIDEFILWYRNRNLYIKFFKEDLISFSQSLEKLVWRMVRDKLLTASAERKGYFENERLVTQSNWWKDKIAYSAVKNKITESIVLVNKEMNLSDKKSKTELENLSEELSEKMFRKIQKLKNKYPVKINEDILKQVKVSQINDKKAIELYTVKNSGLIPRPAYPIIDKDWASWE